MRRRRRERRLPVRGGGVVVVQYGVPVAAVVAIVAGIVVEAGV